MKKLFTLALFALFTQFGISQTVDTIIDKGIYKSYFSYKYREPLYVSYILYKGGGECPRTSYHFINDTKLPTATKSDYKASGYDEGHLANSEDFASNCKNDEMTFRFYNCLPQTPNLNRGIWKHWETEIRKESQKEQLYIICGGIFTEHSKKIGSAYVPDYCWKIVISMKNRQVLHIMLFTNDSNAVEKNITLPELEKLAGYEIPLD